MSKAMENSEKYLFDLHGYLLVENALSEAELARLNAVVDEKQAEAMPPNQSTHRFGNLLDWGPEVREVIANPRLLPYLETLLGPQCRLDHDYLDIIRGGLGPIGATLHGGGTPHDPSQFYDFRDGKMHNGLTVVAYALKDVHPGDGGFACVPGSHKANYPFPRDWADLSEKISPVVTDAPCRAGAAVIFTEALTHGTLPWTGKDERRTLFFKYAPAYLAWGFPRYDAATFPDLSEEARALLMPPANPGVKQRRRAADQEAATKKE